MTLGRELQRLPGLIARIAEGGMLSATEQALVRTFFTAHAEHGLTFASPAISATARSGLSSLEGVAPFLREYPYVVRVQVPTSAVGEVNAILGASRSAHLAPELEVLIFTDARGNVTNIQPNPTSSLGRATPYLRWTGRALLVVGVGVSAYRIGTASEEELPRVVGEEAGGWAGGLGGAALTTTACITFGIATEGLGLILCGLVGGLGGGIGGSALGGEIGEAAGQGGRQGPSPWDNPNKICCFPGDVVVETDKGFTNISKVEIGQRVRAMGGSGYSWSFSDVEDVQLHHGIFTLMRIATDNDEILVTDRHRFMTASGEWIASDEIRTGTKLLAGGAVSKVQHIEHAKQVTNTVYNLKVREGSYCVGGSNILVRDY